MIWVIVGVVVAVVTGLAVAVLLGSMSGSRALGSLVALTLIPTLVFVPIAARIVMDSPGSGGLATFSHAQLEADRLMTERMNVVAGPGMDLQMASDGMLQRSSNAAYVAALERHVIEFNRMAGLPT